MTVELDGCVDPKGGRRDRSPWCAGFLLAGEAERIAGGATAGAPEIPGDRGELAGPREVAGSAHDGTGPVIRVVSYLTSGWPTVATWTLLIVVWLAVSSAAEEGVGGI